MAAQSEKKGNQQLKQLIKAEAIRLGFSFCGFTDAAPPQEFWRFESWLKKGYQAGMKYLDSERHRDSRREPSHLFPDVKTILCLGWPFLLRWPDSANDGSHAWLAAYTGNEDYHQQIMDPMEKLISYIKKQTDGKIHAKGFTDSAPILEREMAVRAGLGWIGKNSCLLSPIHGSSFLLAEIFLDLVIEPDAQFEHEHCGNCRRCIEACPTRCIQADRTIDSSRCIAYLTIENKGAISPTLAEKFGPWFFGCDLCQMVCPWNHKNLSDLEISSLAKEDLLEILRFNEDDFSTRFKHSALSRAKLFGLQRNALIWLGNHPESFDPVLIQKFITKTSNPILIETGTWTLEKGRLR